MALNNQKKMELLAPAGTVAAYEAAVAAGADAVYIGAPSCNARALARPFSLTEITAMAGHARNAGVKLFVAMNSLLKEDEIPQVVSLLAALAEIKIDGLIIQDLGILYLVRKYFPEIRMHASTLMAAHNAPAVRQFAQMGFSRVVLARELTLAEIRQIHAETGVELEVFGHGAMCFSVSGLCLFSSYLGGKSGLRGRCVQPCRRRYTWAGPGREASGGYLFSMNDLSTIDLIPQLREAGVSSLKIEGRMRSAQYVGSVVRAYRKMLDSPPDDQDALFAARELLAEAMGRKVTPGFFLSARPKEIISPYYSGNIGKFLGKVTQIRGDWASLSLRGALGVGDRLRLHQEKSGERESFSLKKMQAGGRSVAMAAAGDKVMVGLPLRAAIGDSLYLVDYQESRDGKKEGEEGPGVRRFRKRLDQQGIEERAARVLAEIAEEGKDSQARSPGRKKGDQHPANTGRKRALSLWLKIDDLRLLSLNMPVQPDKLIVLLRRETFGQAMRIGKELYRRRRILVWALPPVIFPDEMAFYRQAIFSLLAEGFREWQLGHIGQAALLAEAVKDLHANQVVGSCETGGIRPARRQPAKYRPDVKTIADLILFGGYTLNIMNSLGVRLLTDLGIAGAELSIEADRDLLARLMQQRSRCRLGLTVYGLPALFTARACPEHFKFDRVFVSPRQEKFVLLKRGELAVAIPEKPFSLLPQLADLAALGLDFALVDLSWMQKRRAELTELLSDLARPGKELKAGTFNFRGNLL